MLQSFTRTPTLSLGLCPLKHYSQNLVRIISNMNDLGSQEEKTEDLVKNGATKGVGKVYTQI
jgi:hypothetical protein